MLVIQCTLKIFSPYKLFILSALKMFETSLLSIIILMSSAVNRAPVRTLFFAIKAINNKHLP